MNNNPLSIPEWKSLIKDMDETLTLLHMDRKQRPEMVPNPSNPSWKMPAWLLYEMEGMLKMVNSQRERMKLEPLSFTQFERVESMAAGHFDYARKFALYCAEAAIGLETRP